MPSPHASSARGCLSCHDSGPEQLVLGKSHGFRAGQSACSRCHDSTKTRDPSIAERAKDLLTKLDGKPALADRAFHAQPRPRAESEERARAIYDVLLVLEDPAADVHHPGYAKALLDAADRIASGVER
jgi:hypothetical protein